MLLTQKGFWDDKNIGDTRQKLASLYHEKPEIFVEEKQVILGYYEEFEGLSKVLDDKWRVFVGWFLRVPSPETITRSLRTLKSDGTIRLSEEQKEERMQREQQHRFYWGNNDRQ